MFDGSSRNRIAVAIELANGASIKGSIPQGVTASLASAVNREQPFLELFDKAGAVTLVARAQIVSITQTETFSAPDVPHAVDVSEANAFGFLGLEADCDAATARASFRRMVKAYHPDRFESQELPEEMMKYASEMFRQTSKAYAIVKKSLGATDTDDIQNSTETPVA